MRIFILSLLLLLSCSTNPITGRSQLLMMSNSELFPMSFQSYEKVLESSKLSTDANKTAMIKRVGEKMRVAVESYYKKIGQESSLNSYAWEFNLIEDDVANAWCMPGGKVAFYTGILPICQDEKGVAVVMGHEIAHAVANHGNERMSQASLQEAGAALLASTIQTETEQTKELLMSAYGVGSTLLGTLPYSRVHESEADEMGLIFMAIAGYDPSTAVSFWERMKEMSGGASQPEILSTHPSEEKRIKDIKKNLKKALEYYKK